MTDYKVTATLLSEAMDSGESDIWRGELKIDGVEHKWKRGQWKCVGTSRITVYAPSTGADTPQRGLWETPSGKRYWQVAISRRKDAKAIREAIGAAIQAEYRRLYPEMYEDEAEREADNGTTANLGMEGDSGGTSPAGISPLDNPQDRARLRLCPVSIGTSKAGTTPAGRNLPFPT